MNSIAHDGQSHEFATTDELLSLPLVKQYTDDPAVIRLGQGDGQLVAVKLIEDTPVFHVIGTLAQPVVLPKTITGLPLRKGVKE